MHKCLDCRHWGGQGFSRYGSLYMTIRGYEARSCERTPHHDYLDADESYMAFLVDYEEHKVHLYTSAEFGCSHWEDKENNDVEV